MTDRELKLRVWKYIVMSIAITSKANTNSILWEEGKKLIEEIDRKLEEVENG